MAKLGKPIRLIEIEKELTAEYGRKMTFPEIMQGVIKAKNHEIGKEWLQGLRAIKRGKTLIFYTTDVARRQYETEITMGEENGRTQ